MDIVADLRPERSVDRALARAAARHPKRAALITETGRVSFADLARQVSVMAARLAGQGVGPGDVVGLTVREPHRHVVASAALMRLGCTQVLLPTHDPAPLREEVALRCGATAVLAEAADDVPACFETLVPDFDAVFADPPTNAGPLPGADPGIPAIVLPSSGTTGRPKLVPLTQNQIVAQASNSRGAGHRQTLFRPISIEYNNAQRQSLYALCLGATNVHVDPGPLGIAAICRTCGVDTLTLSPMQARALLDATDDDGDASRLPENVDMYIGGSTLGSHLIASVSRRLAPNVHVVYGATECARVTIAGPDLRDRPEGSVGRVLPDVAAEIVDDDGRRLPAGEAGRIRVRTPGMIAGYVDDAELTARSFRDGWFYSGDICELTPDGQLIYHGREDDMMNLNSIKLFPAEIERVMESFPGVVECVAFPLRSPVHGDIPVAAVRAAESVDLGALQVYCRSTLGIRAPRKIVRVDSLPRNAAGKIVRCGLQALVDG